MSGDVTLEGLNDWVQTVLDDPRYRPGLRVLVDHRGSRWQHLTTGQLRQRADDIARDAPRLEGHEHRVALLAGRTVDYGLARMLRVFTDERRGYDFEVFYGDVDAARQWLWQSD